MDVESSKRFVNHDKPVHMLHNIVASVSMSGIKMREGEEESKTAMMHARCNQRSYFESGAGLPGLPLFAFAGHMAKTASDSQGSLAWPA